MYIALIIFSLVLAAAEVYSSKKNSLFNQQVEKPTLWGNFYRFRWVFGVPFAVGSYFIYYPYQSYKIMGFPIMAAAFDSAGSDYVGPLTMPSVIANAALWFFIPSLIFFVWSKFKKVKNANS